MERDQVVVGEFRNEIDAEIAKGHLESAGIKAFIIKDDVGRTFPSLQNTEGVQLSVDETDQARARIVLKEKHT
jgi:tRNA U54 and U55 pseudouridine synthase Pus10